MGLPVGCLGALILVIVVFIVGLMILSVTIRAAVWIANKCLGEAGAGGYTRSSYDDYDDAYDDDDGYYERRRRRPPRRRGTAIPTPSFLKGMGIAFLAWLCSFLISLVFAIFLLGMVGGFGGGGGNNPFGQQPGLNPILQLASWCFQTVTGFLIWSGILSLMLPTSFGRAALVTVFICLIVFVIVIAIVMAVVAIKVAGAGLR